MTDLRHGSGCPGTDLHRFIGAKGDELERCRGCGRFRLVEQAPRPDAPRTVRLRWRCREHGNPVDWRGRGCRRCSEPPLTKAQRRARRRANREDMAA